MLLYCRTSSFDIILHNSKLLFQKCLDKCDNVLNNFYLITIYCNVMVRFQPTFVLLYERCVCMRVCIRWCVCVCVCACVCSLLGVVCVVCVCDSIVCVSLIVLVGLSA